jgi:cytochrome c553
MRAIGRILAVAGALAIALTVMGAIAAMVIVRRGFSARDEPSTIEAFIARTTQRLSVPARMKKLKNPLRVSPEVLADARAHWADHCALCHANDGSGKTTIGQALYPRAPDMRASATQEMSDGELYAIIQNGIRMTGMPAWGKAGEDDEESWGLVAFIRHLPQVTEEELREMEKLNPRSTHEVQEHEEERQFLEEGDEPSGKGGIP